MQYKSSDKSFGYNILNGGFAYGKHTKETKIKMSESKKGENNYFYGKKLTEEHKQKISNSLTDRTVSDEHRLKLSKSLKGRVFSRQHIEKISKFNKDYFKNNEHWMSRKVICDGNVFPNVKECAKHYGIKRTTMNAWLRGQNPMPESFKNMGLSYKGKVN